ncbi:YhcH/YjgK/YiaL family protein [Mucilaginibacter sp.]|uniref:YhcH/YjgK/YiaL family protein n=1 Tax=Mucilaginibacter sp. TaxID=1882438 RepID=UPI003D13DDDF
MIKSKLPKWLFMLICFGCLTHIVAAQKIATDKWTEKSAAKWLNKGEWKNGLKLKVHQSVNKLVFAEQYQKNKAVWDKVFAFLRDSDLANIKPGKYVIDGDNAFASITEAPSKEFDKSAWESHRKYIDLHYVIKGREKIGVASITSATVIIPYNEKTDGANYTAEGQYYLATPDLFFLFFPADVHRPNIKVDGYDKVKKLVIKINMAD